MSVFVPEDGDLSESEQQSVNMIEDTARSSPPLGKIAVALGGAFLVYREYMKRKLSRELDRVAQSSRSDEELLARSNEVFNTFMPTWVSMVAPLLASAYATTIDREKYTMSMDFMEEMAQRYAYSLGVHINNTTADALVKGYAAQVNYGIANRVAVANVVDALGVGARDMKSLVGIWKSKEPQRLSERLMPQSKKARAQQAIAAAVNQRARTVGEQESWNAKEQSKSILWVYAQRNGLISDTATRQWRTADDEMVCKHCGPMHKMEVAIGEQFEVPGVGKMWSPPVHPNCRCTVKLRANVFQDLAGETLQAGRDFGISSVDDQIAATVVAKAQKTARRAGDDYWDERDVRRLQNGRFTFKNQPNGFGVDTRMKRPAYKERDEVDDLLSQMDDRLREAAEPLPIIRSNRKETMDSIKSDMNEIQSNRSEIKSNGIKSNGIRSNGIKSNKIESVSSSQKIESVPNKQRIESKSKEQVAIEARAEDKAAIEIKSKIKSLNENKIVAILSQKTKAEVKSLPGESTVELRTPLYALSEITNLDDPEYEDHGATVLFSGSGKVFTDNYEAIGHGYNEYIEDKDNTFIDGLMTNSAGAGDRITHAVEEDPSTGSTYKVTLTRRQLANVLDWVRGQSLEEEASEEFTPFESRTTNATIYVGEFPQDTETLTYSDIAETYRMYDHVLKNSPTVFRIEAVNSRDTVDYRSFGSNTATMGAGSAYSRELAEVEDLGFGVNVEIVTLRPMMD